MPALSPQFPILCDVLCGSVPLWQKTARATQPAPISTQEKYMKSWDSSGFIGWR
jgi:hypothetical protein